MATDSQFQVVACGRCGATWSAPLGLDQPGQATFAKLVREHKTLEAIRFIREQTGLGLGDAKAILYHITDKPGFCRWCKGTLAEGTFVTCAACGAVNYDWR